MAKPFLIFRPRAAGVWYIFAVSDRRARQQTLPNGPAKFQIKSHLMDTYRNFIKGEWVESSSQKTTENVNPANTEDVLGLVRLSTREEARRAVEAAAVGLREEKHLLGRGAGARLQQLA